MAWKDIKKYIPTYGNIYAPVTRKEHGRFWNLAKKGGLV